MSAGRVERTVAGAPLTLQLRGVELPATVDVDDQVVGSHGPVTIRRWRTDVDSRPEAATCSLSIRAAALEVAGLVGTPQLGDELIVDLSAEAVTAFTAPAGAVRRFTGTLTDAELLPGGVYKLAAAGPQARLGRVTIGEPPWPVELDGERVERVLYAAQAQAPELVITDPDAGTVNVLALDVDAQGALNLIDQLSQDGGGELVELRDGSLTFHDAEHRRGVASSVELRAGEVMAPATWKATLKGIVNDLTVRYGVDGDSSVRVVDELSTTSPIGRMAAQLSTQLDDAAAAHLRAFDVVGRRSSQRWRIEQLAVDLVATVAPAKAGQLLALSFGDLVDVVGFPVAGPFAVAALWVEGIDEQITARSWRLDLSVSEFALTAPGPRFVDVADSWAIDELPDDLSILSAVSWWPNGGRDSLGRFVDVPAGLDIDDVPDAELIASASY